jgi:hypothetical protein
LFPSIDERAVNERERRRKKKVGYLPYQHDVPFERFFRCNFFYAVERRNKDDSLSKNVALVRLDVRKDSQFEFGNLFFLN